MIARGSVVGITSAGIDARLPGARAGAAVRCGGRAGTVLAVDAQRVRIALYESSDGLGVGTWVVSAPATDSLPLGTCALGRAIDARGQAIDGGPPLRGPRVAVSAQAPPPASRAPVNRPLWTGVRAIDALLTIGRGARVGLFGSPGAGKSTLVESIVGGCTADAVVVGLIGERGREAQQWLNALDPRTTIVCATSDRSAAERVRAANVAFAQAEALRRRGLHVLLVVDSLARVAAALRERALAGGEAAGRGGYPPSVFGALAALVERAGNAFGGSITLVATVLDDGDARDPVSDAARSLLDGHIQLSQRLAHAGRFPAIDTLASTSRTMDAVVEPAHRDAARAVRSALARLERIDDARALGIVPDDPQTRAAIEAEPLLERLLRQGPRPCGQAAVLEQLRAAADICERTPWTS